MIKIGLTGGIGTGKSTVAKVFEVLGVPVYNSDDRTKKLYLKDVELKNEMISHFGNKVYDETGMLNKEYLRKLIFNDKEKLSLINKIVHPRVQQDFEKWLLQNRNSNYIIKEAAILIESGAYKNVDKIIVVTSPMNLRMQRVKNRDNSTEKEVRKRIDNQLSEKELLRFADFEIRNTESESLINQVLNLNKLLLKN